MVEKGKLLASPRGGFHGAPGGADFGEDEGGSLNSVAAVIPLYNHEKYIAEAIQSLLDQTVPVESIVLIDDGSTDSSVEVASAFNDPRIRIIRQANAGAHAALNRGIAEAECEYVALLNSDDAYLPSRVERCLGFMKQHPEIDLLFTRLRLIDSDSRVMAASEPRAKWFENAWALGREDLVEWLGAANFAGTTSNFFARREWLLAHPFRDYRYAHDYYALILCALSGRLGLLREELLSYRVHATNTITTRPELLIKEMLRLNLDLLRETAPRLRADVRFREAFMRYERAAWNNVSSFHAGLFQCLLAAIAEKTDATRLLEAMDAVTFPEMRRYPNQSPLPGQGKYEEMKEERALWKQHARLLAAVSASRWVAFGGLFCRLVKDEGKTVAEKHRALAERLRRSRWLALGCRLGAPSARAVIELCKAPN